MSHMWQKYTLGKRILALLLAVLMMADSFTVSAAITDTEVSTEISTETSTEASASQPEDTEDSTEINTETVYTEEDTEKDTEEPVIETPDEVQPIGETEEKDYYLTFNGERLDVYESDYTVWNPVSFIGKEIRLQLYCNDEPVTLENPDGVEIYVSGNETTVQSAISYEKTKDGVFLIIEPDKANSGKGLSINDTFTVNMVYFIQSTGKLYSFVYGLCSSNVQIGWEDTAQLVDDGDTYELDYAAYYRVINLAQYMKGVTITSSDPSVLKVAEVGGVIKMAAQKLGTADLTVKYTQNGTKGEKTIHVKVTSPEQLKLGYLDEDNKSVPFDEENTFKLENGAKLSIDTNVSPRLLSNLKIEVDDGSILRINGKISETLVPDSTGAYYKSWNKTTAQIEALKAGKTTLTISATYNGEVCTQTITVRVLGETELQVRKAYLADVAGGYETEDTRLSSYTATSPLRLSYLALMDENEEGAVVLADKSGYDIVILDTEGNEDADAFTINWVNDSIFYIVPNTAGIDGYKLQITSKEDSDVEETIALSSSIQKILYESYNSDSKELAKPAETIAVIEGQEKKVYVEIPNEAVDQVSDSGLSALKDYGVEIAVNKEFATTESETTIVEYTITYTPNTKTPNGMFSVKFGADTECYAEAYVYLYKTFTDAEEASAVTQKDVSELLTTDENETLSNVRIGDYVVTLKKMEDGTKAAVLTGYLGSASALYMPKSFRVPVIVTESGEKITVIEQTVPVIGVKAGVFDTKAGYTQPTNVYVYDGYTYFEGEGGWTSTGKRTTYYLYDDQGDTVTDSKKLYVQNGMLFAEDADTYKCIDAGNVSIVPVVEDAVVLYKNSAASQAEIKLQKSANVSGYDLKLTEEKAYLLKDGEEGKEATGLEVTFADGFYVNYADGEESGTYDLQLVPYTMIKGKAVNLPEVSVKVTVSIDGAAPEVKITNSSLTLNTYLGDKAAVMLDVASSYGTVTGLAWSEASAKAAETAGLSLEKDEEQNWLLKWNGTGTITKNLKFEVAFTVDGFEESGDTKIATQTITVNSKKVQPTVKLSASTVTFTEYPYETRSMSMTITDGLYDGSFDSLGFKCTSKPKGAGEADVLPGSYVDDPVGTFRVNVSNNAVPGTYKFTLTPKLDSEGTISAKPVTLTVVVKGTKPSVKFASTATVTLNSNYYNTTETLPQLVYSAGADASMGVFTNSAENWMITTEVASKPKNADESLVTLTPVYNGKTWSQLEAEMQADNIAAWGDVYKLDEISFAAGVKSGAVAGTYVFKIKVPIGVVEDEYELEIIWAETTATVKVVSTLPAFKLTASTITLDAAYPYDGEMDESADVSAAFTQLMLDDDYTLVVPKTDDDVVAEASDKVTTFDFGNNQNAKACVLTYAFENGMIVFAVQGAGLTKGGTITINPVVEAPTGEIIELKPVKVTLKVTNSSKATVIGKVKALTVNPYLNSAETVANLSVKGFTETAGLDYTYDYEFIPADANAAWAEENGYLLKVSEDGTIISAVKETAEEAETTENGWLGIKDGKYTYNLVGVVTAKEQGDEDGETAAVTYTKPLTFTVTVKRKALTVVPKNSSITVYTDRAETVEREDGTKCYKLTVPVSVKEQAGIVIQSYGTEIAANSMSAKGVETKFVSDDNGGSMLVITYPCDIYKTVKKLTITPDVYEYLDANMAFSSFSVTIAHKTTGAKAAFKDATVTLNRYETDRITNSITEPESFTVTGMELVSIINKSTKKVVTDMFDVEVNEAGEDSFIMITIKEEYIDEISNGTYTVTVTSYTGMEEAEEPSETPEDESNVAETALTVQSDEAKSYKLTDPLQNCSFNINITQPKLTLSVNSKTVSFYPEVEAYGKEVIVGAAYGEAYVEVTKTETVTASKNPKTKAVDVEPEGIEPFRSVTFMALEGAAAGSDTYNIKVYVRNRGGSEDILAGTISKAVTATIKNLPSKAALTSSKLTFSPYLEESVSTSIKDTELMALSGDGKINYSIAVSETNSNYKELAEDKKNDVLEVTGNADGTITATAKKFPEKNATYYYTAKISVRAGEHTHRTYTANFQIAVKNTMPKAALRETTVTLNNAYPGIPALGKISLSTGNEMWQLTDMNRWDLTVKNGKNQDVTDKNYFDVYFLEDASFMAGFYAEDEGSLFAVPAGTYKIEITPTAERKNAGDEAENITLAKTVLTVKVVSNRPTVKYVATKLTVNTYTNQPQTTKLTLSNGGTFVVGSKAVCAKAPKGVTVKEDGTVEGISLTLAKDGTLTAQAERSVAAGTYTYTITPVTRIDDCRIALDSKNVTVVVQSTMPTAVLSANKVTVNTLFADTYSAEIKVTAKNAGADYTYAFTTDEIVFNEPKAKQTKKDDAAVLLENMNVSVGEDGTAVIRVSLPTDETVANGTYSFKLTPGIKTGNKTGAEYDNASYDLKAVTFSVAVENKKPTVSAKVSGSIDLVKRNTSFVTAQLSFSKQAYETLGDIESVRLIDKSTGKTSSDFFVNGRSDITAGTVVISTNYRKELAAGKTYALQIEVTTQNGGTYLTNVSIKTTQSNYKVTGAASVFYTEANSADINLTVTEGVSLKNVKVTKAVIGKKTLKADDFGCTLRNSGESIELWSNADLTQYKGQTLKVTFEVTPNGLASNKKPVTITVSLTIK